MSKSIPRHSIRSSMLPIDGAEPPVWEVTHGLVPYSFAVERMEELAVNISLGKEPERIWLLEHPPLYTGGTSAKKADLIDGVKLPVHKTGRGGEYTYHGPGQRVAYVMLNLKNRQPDVRAFVSSLETWVIHTLAQFNVVGERREDRVGVWVKRPDKPLLNGGSCHEDKIAAIGIRIKKWVTLHGISINLEPDLSHYDGIVPCGIEEHGVTSLVDLGLPVTMEDLDIALKRGFVEIFGGVRS